MERVSMIEALSHERFANDPATRAVWLPADRMARYQWAKVIGAAFMSAIFAGWMLIQWSNTLMRIVAATLLAVTAGITLKSIINDFARTRGREISIEAGVLRIAQPSGNTDVRLAGVAHGEWREDTEASVGLWLFDERGQLLAHIESAFLADQAEARIFLGWLRKITGAKFDVRWPDGAGIT